MFAHRHTFIVLIDPDEYIVLKRPRQAPYDLQQQQGQQGPQQQQGPAAAAVPGPQAGGWRPHLPTFLQPFEAHGGLVMHWQLVGPSGHVRRPKGPTLLEYTQVGRGQEQRGSFGSGRVARQLSPDMWCVR